MHPSSCFRTTATVFLLMLPLLATTKAHGQISPATTTTTVTAGPDSAQVNTVVVPDSVRRTAKLFGLKMTKPSKAGLLSALLPGAGQIYNRRWWKLPLVYGAVGGTLYGELFYQRRYKIFIQARDNRISGLPDNNSITQGLQGNTIDRGINLYRRQRDVFIAYVALAHAAQILDAVVDAHLKDFDISDDLSLRWEPTLMHIPTAAVATPGIGVTLTFK
jgi:hypothetical protein